MGKIKISKIAIGVFPPILSTLVVVASTQYLAIFLKYLLVRTHSFSISWTFIFYDCFTRKLMKQYMLIYYRAGTKPAYKTKSKAIFQWLPFLWEDELNEGWMKWFTTGLIQFNILTSNRKQRMHTVFISETKQLQLSWRIQNHQNTLE